MVRVMQKSFDTVQHDAKTRALYRFHCCAEVMQQRLDFPPVNVAAYRILEDGVDEVFVFMTHGLIFG